MRSIPNYIKLLAKIGVSSLILMSLLRIVLFFLIRNQETADTVHLTSDIMNSFLYGFRFDLVITAYALFVPTFILGIASFLPKKMKQIHHLIFGYIALFYASILFIQCADMPYYMQFGSRLNTGALLWTDNTDYMFKMILGEWSFYLYFILFILLIIGVIILFNRFFKQFNTTTNQQKWYAKIAWFLLFGLSLALSARGRVTIKSPIRVGTAYFSNDQTLNKLALNPVFTFGHSYLADKKSGGKIKLMDNAKALQLSQAYLAQLTTDSSIIKLNNKWHAQLTSNKRNKNVVLVLMESMGSYKLGKYNGPKNITPTLHQLIPKSIYFNNIYSAGIHTFNGIYSTLFSYPAIYKQQPLTKHINKKHNGIASILKQNSYSTSYFTTHDPQFDNVAGFLMANDIENIYSDYPIGKELSSNGVPDHLMFETALPILDAKSNSSKNPFFAIFMTASDHKPFIVPENIDFKPKSTELENQITEYADWSIGQFLANASKKEWYNNTIFVFVADHGLYKGHTYNMPLSFHASPLIIYTPNVAITDTLNCLGGQIDVAPTLLGMLNIKHQNNTMGIDLLKQHRPFMYFSADDKLGCLDDTHYLILQNENPEQLYEYANLDQTNRINEFPAKVNSMKQYAFSMLQATQVFQSNK